MKLRIGTRRSPLAQTQTKSVIDLISAVRPDIEFETRFIATVADKDRVSKFHEFGMIGVFTAEHEERLVRKEVDLVVHSLKDLPTNLMEGTVLAAVPEREDPRDVLCGARLADLRPGARVGTGSLRRQAQILALRPDVEVVPIRGNVQPRLKKVGGPDGVDAVILAAAGLNRLALDGEIAEVLDPVQFPYAVGQGALGIQVRAEDEELRAVLKEIEDPLSRAEVDAERSLLHDLGGGCSLPVGVMAVRREGRIALQGQVTSVRGEDRIVAVEDDLPENAVALGIATANSLRAMGGVECLERSYRDFCQHYRFITSQAH